MVESEHVQRFIRGSIASPHTLELTARDVKAIQEATTTSAKRAGFGEQVSLKGGMIKLSKCRELCSKRKEKTRNKLERETREKKSGQKSKQFSADSGLVSYWRSFIYRKVL